MAEPQAVATATVLSDGEVLVAGGYDGFTEHVGGSAPWQLLAELFVPGTRSWRPAAPMLAPGVEPRAALAPTITHLRQSHLRWRDTKARGRVHRKSGPVTGTTFSFVLNESATVDLVFVKHVRGHEINGDCVIEARGRRGRPCVRTISKGDISVAGKTGENSVAFDGRTSRSPRLGPGDYTLEVSATSQAGQSTIRDIRFTIL